MMPRPTISPVLEARELWLSAYLLASGCKLVQILPVGTRRHHYVFANVNDRAYTLLYEWKDRDHSALVDARVLMDCYKFLVNESREVTYEEGPKNYDDEQPA